MRYEKRTSLWNSGERFLPGGSETLSEGTRGDLQEGSETTMVIKFPERCGGDAEDAVGAQAVLCSFCSKRVATRRCDRPIGWTHYVGHPPRSLMERAKRADNAFVKIAMEEPVWCGKTMCKECAVSLGCDVDFCPDCIRLIIEKT